MRVFSAVVDAGSFAGAADKLELSRGMATRYVAQLETHLGARLLNRTTRKLSLTEAGSDYYQRATQVLGMVEEAETAVAQEASVPRGTLRVTSSVAFGIRHLGWAIPEYLQRYPGVQVDVTLNDRVVDLVEEGFDVAIRCARRIDPGLIARKLTRARIVACASPGYLKKHGTPRSPEELAGHNCLSYAYWSLQNEWHFRRKGAERTVRVSGNLRGNNGDILVNAAIEGLGVILHPMFLVYEALRQKKLERILSDWEVDDLGVFAVYPNRKFLPPKVRSFIDFLADRFGPEPYWDSESEPKDSKPK
ncbi:MAG: LysR family transcriptional regulator [Betaproteobacteria bacterium]|nr:LysR family transcriptional regulator [Betaproteobacteria bacterium]MBI2959143.1 LysR family transcriptional regulator [Betaproteobacteria bacterium]